MRTISIAEDFSVFPGGRVPEDGPFSGQEFRDKFLLPIFSGTEKVERGCQFKDDLAQFLLPWLA